ncbi:hypothetical protein [Pseudoduganella chitinolytica]|uniref:Uncharacterized protein n=1 Tax=Pseudoduganella chitinolytica TaxID=34070 RepID=A0ABY8BBZ5_9BURK|nr:hypothetical protein [Pseudoduganella chitinolytica]WEF32688.1 hypothetical protein PX653_25300 [Pseudoduganella chitinolytica]
MHAIKLEQSNMHNTIPPSSYTPMSMAAADSEPASSQRRAVPRRPLSPDSETDNTPKRLRHEVPMQGLAMRTRLLSLESATPINEPEEIKSALAQAHAFVTKRKATFQDSDNMHVKSAAIMLDRTLCLASNVSQGGQHLSSFAEDNRHAGHYIRSFDHDLLVSDRAKANQLPIARLVGERKDDAKGYAANVGLVPNVHSLRLYQLGKLTPGKGDIKQRPLQTSPGNAELYDASLKYRTDVTQHVQTQLTGSKNIQVGAYEDYPAVMVHCDARTFLDVTKKEKKELGTAAESFTQFLMSHYLGIVNAEAAKMGLNTATVERSSFGHLTPSVASTANSFRINLGMMPPAYAEAHVRALRILDQELDSFQASFGNGHQVNLAPFEPSEHRLELNKDKNLLQLAFTKAESGGKRLITNTMRTLNARNAVDSESFALHRRSSADAAVADPLSATLTNLFSQVGFVKNSKGGMTMSTNTEPKPYSITAGQNAVPPTTGGAAEAPPLSAAYDAYLQKFSRNLAKVGTAIPGQAGGTQEHLARIAGTLHPNNPDIAVALDLANQLLMVHTLDKLQAGKGADETDFGYGSDSDVEDGDVRGSKMILHNGMRSLLGATNSARAILFGGEANNVGIAYDKPYYETAGAIRDAEIQVKEQADAQIVIKDINACVTDATKGDGKRNVAEAYPNARAWIIDTTSATTAQMHEVYEQFKEAETAELLYFASSGLKNEQAGADQNNYGSLRVFGKAGDGDANKQRVGEVLGAIAGTDRGLAQFSHEHRRTMKAMGLVPTNQSIVMPVRSDVVMADAPFDAG